MDRNFSSSSSAFLPVSEAQFPPNRRPFDVTKDIISIFLPALSEVSDDSYVSASLSLVDNRVLYYVNDFRDHADVTLGIDLDRIASLTWELSSSIDYYLGGTLSLFSAMSHNGEAFYEKPWFDCCISFDVTNLSSGLIKYSHEEGPVSLFRSNLDELRRCYDHKLGEEIQELICFAERKEEEIRQEFPRVSESYLTRFDYDGTLSFNVVVMMGKSDL